MILTVNGADFSKANIGETNGYSVIVSGRGNSTTNWVDKDTKLTMSITINANYTYESLEITVGGNPLNSGFTATHNNGTVTLEIPANLISGVVRIKVNATSTTTGGGEGGGESGSTTPNYTFTINPTPSNATVKLTASGYTQSDNSITVASGTSVSWTVSANGYQTKNGSETITGNKTLPVYLTAVSSGGDVSSIDLSTLTLNHVKSSKMSATDNKENLVYNQETHELSINKTGWYKISYFEQPVQVGMEIEIETYFSNSISGNFMGIFITEDLVDGISETSTNPTSYWPAPSIFGVYAPGTPNNSEMIYKWCKNNGKIKTADSLKGDAMNNKTVKLKLYESGVKCYINDAELSWSTGSVENPMSTGTNYYFGCHNNCTSGSPVVSKINYIGPIR